MNDSSQRVSRPVNKTIRKHMTYLKWRINHSRRLLRFKDIHKGEGCFVIGNGPSISKMDLSPLRDYHTFGLNKIYLIFDKVDLNLSYYVAVNPLVIQQSVDQIESLSCPAFLPFGSRLKVGHRLDHIHYIFKGGPHTFHENLLRPISGGYTVTYAAMQIAFYMGFTHVFLIGVDHHYVATGNPNEAQLSEGADMNHFDPRYFRDAVWNLPDLEGSELSYHLAKFYFTRAGRQIHDATVDGKLQIFPKISFHQALDMCSKK